MTAKQTQALDALLSGCTRKQAAAAAHVGESTLRRWMASDEDFKTAYRKAVSEILEQTTRKAQTAAGEAVDVLRSIMRDTSEQAAPRVSAADKVLSHAAKLTEQADILARLDVLEEAAREGGD